MAKEVVFKFKVEVDGKEVEQTVSSIDGFQKRISDLQTKLNAAPLGSKQFQELQKELKKTEGAFDAAKSKNQSFLDNLSQAPGILGSLGQSIQGAGKLFSSFNNVLKFSFFGILATLITKVVEKLSQMEGVLDPLTKITEIFSTVIGKLANVIMKPLSFIIEGVALGFEKLGNILGKITGDGETYGETLGNISEGLDELEDSQASFDLQLQKSNRALAEAREVAADQTKSLEERKKALQDADAVERDLAKQNRERTLQRARLQAQQIAAELGFNEERIKAIAKYDAKALESFTKEVDGFKGLNRDKTNALLGYIGQVEEISAQEAKIGKKTASAVKALDNEEKQRLETKRKEAADAAKQRRADQIADYDAQIKLLIGFQNYTEKKDADYYNNLEKKLQDFYTKRNELEDKDNKLSKSQKEIRRKEQEKAISDAIKTDQEARKKASEDEIKKASEDFQKLLAIETQKNQAILDESTLFYEKMKLKYGDDSNEAIAAAKKKNEAQLQLYADELAALMTRQKDGKILTESEIKRIGELTKTIAQFGLFQEQEAQKDIDRETRKNVEKNLLRMKELEESINSQYTSLEEKKSFIEEENRIAKENYDMQLLAAGENATKRQEIERGYTDFLQSQSDKRVKIEIDSINARAQMLTSYVNLVGQVGGLLAQIAGKNKGIAIAGIIIEQGAALAKVLISRSSAIATATAAAAPFLANPLTAIPAQATLTKTIIQANISAALSAAGIIAGAAKGIADINKAETGGGAETTEQPRKLASGGMVSGPGTEKSDSIPAMLSNGESVINARSTRMFAPLLSAINQMGGGEAFQFGGIVSSSDMNLQQQNQSLISALSGQEPQPIKTYVVATDMTSQQQFDRAQKSRSTL